MTKTARKAFTMAPRPPSGDVDGVPSVIRVWIGGLQEWQRLETSLVARMLEAGVTDGQISRIRAVLKRAFLKWRPETALLISEDDRDVVLPIVENMAHRERVTVNGLIYELLQREIRALPGDTYWGTKSGGTASPSLHCLPHDREMTNALREKPYASRHVPESRHL